MAPQRFDRYMVKVGAGRHPKFARLTDGERCAHFLGVLSIAAQSPSPGGMTDRYIVVQDAWRWVRVNENGEPVAFSEAAYETQEIAVEELEASEDRNAHPDVDVVIRSHPKAAG